MLQIVEGCNLRLVRMFIHLPALQLVSVSPPFHRENLLLVIENFFIAIYKCTHHFTEVRLILFGLQVLSC